MTNFLSRQVTTFRNCRTGLPRTLRVCAWLFWAVGAFIFAVPYYYAFFDTRIGAMAFVSFSFAAGIFGLIGYGFSRLSEYTNKDKYSRLEKVVLWCFGGAAAYGVLLLGIWVLVEYLAKRA